MNTTCNAPLKEHFDYLEVWEQGMRTGVLTGRPFSMSTMITYCYYMVDFLIEYEQLNANTMRRALSAIPPEHFAKREKLHRTLISFAKLLIEEGVLADSELPRLIKMKPKRHLPIRKVVVSEKQVENLIDACKTPLERLIVVLLVSTGLRASEACALQVNDIDFENQALVVRFAKWGKSRRVGLTAMAVSVIRRYLERVPHSSDTYLFLNRKGQPMDRHGLYQRLERIGKRVGVDVSPHALRRAFVTINANKGRPLPMLQMACGHSDITTTRSYCMTTEEEVINTMKSWD